METQQVTIDIGGEKTVRVNADLFSLVGDNKFAVMLSDRWQQKARSDTDSIFVDYSPKVFMPLIEWLRLVRDSEPDMVTPVRVDPGYLTSWIRMMIASSFHPQVFRKANLTGKDLCMAGCSLRLCVDAGLGPDCFGYFSPWPFKVTDLKEGGFTAAELREAGFTDVTLLARAGFCTSELEAAGFDKHEAAASTGLTAAHMAAAAAYDASNIPNPWRDRPPPVKAPPWPLNKGFQKGGYHNAYPSLGLWPSPTLKGKGKGHWDSLAFGTFVPPRPQPPVGFLPASEFGDSEGSM